MVEPKPNTVRSLDDYYRVMQKALEAAGAEFVQPKASAAESEPVMLVIAPADYSAGDTTQYDGRQKPEMVARDDADWRRL